VKPVEHLPIIKVKWAFASKTNKVYTLFDFLHYTLLNFIGNQSVKGTTTILSKWLVPFNMGEMSITDWSRASFFTFISMINCGWSVNKQPNCWQTWEMFVKHSQFLCANQNLTQWQMFQEMLPKQWLNHDSHNSHMLQAWEEAKNRDSFWHLVSLLCTKRSKYPNNLLTNTTKFALRP
jgi:hypothetical protein